jgi:hypothetical protein
MGTKIDPNLDTEEQTMKRSMSRMTGWYAAAALAAGVMAAPVAFAQDAGLAAQQQAHQAAQQKKEQNRENRAERREQKREREQLSNMPKPVRETLKAETQNATNVDYYRAEGQDSSGGKGREFGAKFTNAQNHQIDLRVDREGKVISRQDLTAATATAQAPAAPAQQPVPAPVPAPTPAPTTPAPTASTQAPESGNPIYRRLQATEVPANIRAIFDKDTKNGRDVHYYRTKYGTQLAYEAKWTDANGKDMKHYVSDAGTTLVRGEDVDNDNAQTAGASTPASTSSKTNTSIKTGRAQLKELPKSVQTQVSRMTEGASNVDLYNTKYGDQQAYEAKYTTKAGKHMAVYFDKDGKVLSQKEEK